MTSDDTQSDRLIMKLANDNAIVMVDDDDVDIRMMKRCVALSNLQNEFLSFDSGRAFLDYAKTIVTGQTPMPAIVFLDINMPQMSGFDVLEELRSHHELKELPVVAMLTHSDRQADVQRAQTYGAGFVEKFSSRKDAVEFLESLV